MSHNVRLITGFSEVGNSANLTAKCLSCLLPLRLSLYAEGGVAQKLIGATSIVLWLAALLLIQSRTAVPAAVLILGAYLYFGKKGSVSRGTLIGAGVVVVIFLGVALLSPGYRGRFSESSIRYILWYLAWRAFLHNPVLGVGVGRFTEVFLHQTSPGLYMLMGGKAEVGGWAARGESQEVSTHSILFELLAETGTLGLLAYGWFALSVVMNAIHSLRDSEGQGPSFVEATLPALIAGYIGFLFYSLTGGGTRERVLYVFVGLVGAASQLLARMNFDRQAELKRA